MQKKKFKSNKIRLFLVLFFIILILYVIIKPKNYEKIYKIDGVTITESFNKQTKFYTFKIEVDNQQFITKINHKYIHSKKLIKNISVNTKDNTTCLILKSDKLNTYPICKQNDEYLSYYLLENKNLIPEEYFQNKISESTTYNNLTIYNLNNHKYLVWNYNSFYIVDNNKVQEINLFNEDVYSIPLASQTKNYFLIPNYEEKYNFNKIYIVDINTAKVRELNLKNSISYESYILGEHNKRIYLVDKKNQKEYEIYPKRLLIDNIINKNSGKFLENGEWKSISLNKLITQENSFTNIKEIDFILEDNKLYEVLDEQKTLVSNDSVKKIITIINNTVYYLKDDKLYSFNEYQGEVLIMQNFEWNFNFDNMIFIY